MLHSEMGLNRLKEVAPFSFGIRAKNEELVLPPNLLVFCEYRIIFRRSYFIIAQQQVKNLVVKPSGPGALSGFIIERAFLTSSMVIGAVRKLLSSKLRN